MGLIRSPLGALGALMVLLEGIASVSLIPLQQQPELQRLLVYTIVGSVSLTTLLIVVIVGWFAFRRPGLLFNPQDIDPSVHLPLYGPSDLPTTDDVVIPSGSIILTRIEDDDDGEQVE